MSNPMADGTANAFLVVGSLVAGIYSAFQITGKDNADFLYLAVIFLSVFNILTCLRRMWR